MPIPTPATHQNLFARVLDRVHAAIETLASSGDLPAGLDASRVVAEPPRDPSHGDMATNAAMVLAKDAGKKPRELADALAAVLAEDPLIESVAVAGPGFINLTMKREAWINELRAAISGGTEYGRSGFGSAKPVNVEYVSANPTGPMHIGHCRGAVFGDALANLLAFTGHAVTREYYINDAGAQVDTLARSAFLRYREALGEDIGAIPEGLYPGDYLVPVGQALVRMHNGTLLKKDEADRLPVVRQVAVEFMLIQILKDLEKLNIRFDTYFSERALIEGAVKFSAPDERPVFYFAKSSYDLTPKGRGGIRAYLADRKLKELQVANPTITSLTFSVEEPAGDLGKPKYLSETLEALNKRDLVYRGRLPPPKGAPVDDWEDREQTLFRSSTFGDEVDRPLMKSDGSYTYFASDIAYHRSKIDRGFRELIDVWGADHGGYIKRMQAAVKAVSGGEGALDVKVVQLVRLLRAGEQVRMSKRSGDFVTLREVVDEVGRDAVRFMMLFRKNDAVLDFDLAKVIEQSKDNPVFYVQYGHARGRSVFRNAREALPSLSEDALSPQSLLNAALERLEHPGEIALIKRVGQYPRVVEAAALAHEPHRIAFYLYELASEFHAHWTQGNHLPHLRFIILDDPKITVARLALVQGVVTVLASGLKLLGVEAPEEMR